MDLDALKRLGLTVGGAALVALNKKLGLNLSDTDIAAIAALIIAAVTGSNWKAAKLAGAKAAEVVVSVPDAAAVINAPGAP